MDFDKNPGISENDITDYETYKKRRTFMKTAAGLGIVASTGLAMKSFSGDAKAKTSNYSTTEKTTSYKSITSYCNYYEFGTSKRDPAKHAHSLVTSPWTVDVDGECDNPGTYDLEDLLKPVSIEERIYRFRCVEGWSMVIPWMGFPLADLIKRMQPNSKAKYVRFETLYDPDNMPGQRTDSLSWPYVEGLRMDEAMNPLTLLSTGLYGKDLLNQNGAPLRLVVPWKYGFKSIKSIARISFTELQPLNSWQLSSSSEYGFYSNVNPDVPHQRWSQAKERRVGEFTKRKTQLFNGYEKEVAELYTGMDLKRFF
ncbi:protein-methionine-sulfoxide reductase catalytic subunit MsrP [Leucothrix arctica]|uniref:Protein-methionine-sulfoxide reductase catalytic subunit MsrP n=1 Tax=Leucothrix arctica TaxID=1481894 RepID=A0A317C6L8_9GAMM|nr:protein-methionine-sulfoxide reductase catalytic subunit MsrP [Leucothrix arctica]PWQ94276.1 protein-methionine-sulfoxide reductase catalytic subunit MsrP [Leucothrix arctica]